MKLFPALALLALTATAPTLIARADEKAPKTAARKSIRPTKSADLNGDAVNFPADFSAPRTLLLLAFERNHQYLIDGWAKGLKLKETDVDWYELPIVGEKSERGRRSLDNAMKDDGQSRAERSRVVTLYTDARQWIAPLGHTKTDSIYIVVASKNGEVLAIQQGAFDAKKAGVIQKAWRKK